MNEHDPRLGDHEAEWRELDDEVQAFLIKLESMGWDLARLIDMWHRLKKDGVLGHDKEDPTASQEDPDAD